jgi:hypothetical protein
MARLGPVCFANKLPLIGVKRTRRRCTSTTEFDRQHRPKADIGLMQADAPERLGPKLIVRRFSGAFKST